MNNIPVYTFTLLKETFQNTNMPNHTLWNTHIVYPEAEIKVEILISICLIRAREYIIHEFSHRRCLCLVISILKTHPDDLGIQAWATFVFLCLCAAPFAITFGFWLFSSAEQNVFPEQMVMGWRATESIRFSSQSFSLCGWMVFSSRETKWSEIPPYRKFFDL